MKEPGETCELTKYLMKLTQASLVHRMSHSFWFWLLYMCQPTVMWNNRKGSHQSPHKPLVIISVSIGTT